MSLIEYTIDGKVDKVELALKRIQLGALSPEPFYVCYSGGKDSKVLRRLMEMSDTIKEEQKSPAIGDDFYDILEDYLGNKRGDEK